MYIITHKKFPRNCKTTEFINLAITGLFFNIVITYFLTGSSKFLLTLCYCTHLHSLIEEAQSLLHHKIIIIRLN